MSHFTWSLGARAEKEARFLVHLTDMKRSLAAVSYTVSAAAAEEDPPSCPHPAPASSGPDSLGESEALLVLPLQSGHGVWWRVDISQWCRLPGSSGSQLSLFFRVISVFVSGPGSGRLAPASATPPAGPAEAAEVSTEKSEAAPCPGPGRGGPAAAAGGGNMAANGLPCSAATRALAAARGGGCPGWGKGLGGGKPRGREGKSGPWWERNPISGKGGLEAEDALGYH